MVGVIRRLRKDVTKQEVHFHGVPNVEVHGYCAKTMEVFEYFGCFWHGCPCMLTRQKPIGNIEETLLSRYEETMARMHK
jgi:G:T-mismatch repair DNA endonuclease (very short patch repair protein)